jgi:Putative peptidoglycan binding domain
MCLAKVRIKRAKKLKIRKEEKYMNRKKEIVTAVLLSGSIGIGAQSLFAQGMPGGGPSGPSTPGQTTGPTVPQPEPTIPQQTQPTIPGQPAPGLPQTAPMPGQPGTIPERMQPPQSQQGMVISPDDIRSAQQALKAKGLNPGVDGRMDAQTQQAIRDFQKANNLPVTGVLDEKTAAKLGVNMKGSTTPSQGSGSAMPRSNSSKSPGTVQ